MLVTAHRATNVDDPARLAVLVSVVEELAAGTARCCSRCTPGPGTGSQAAGWWAGLAAVPGVRLVEPLGYLELLQALAASRLVVTDSGGVQEEASYLGVPVVVMRSTTPRWEGVENGAAVLAGDEGPRVLRRAAATPTRELARVAALPCPYGDGTRGPGGRGLADRSCALLAPREPDLLTASAAAG